MFEQASRLKFRFVTQKGTLTTEDLWDLPLSSTGVSLDSIAIELNKKIKDNSQESFVAKKTNINSILELKLDILKHIINCRQLAIEEENNAEDRKRKKEQILNILAEKEDDSLKNKSVSNLKKMLEDL